MIYGIWCIVTGGRTGRREAWLNEDGTIVMFSDQSEAQARADELNRTMNGPNASATFRYTVQERG